jgi:hypothetical protein
MTGLWTALADYQKVNIWSVQCELLFAMARRTVTIELLGIAGHFYTIVGVHDVIPLARLKTVWPKE